jgi:hypothetical protein
MQTYCIVARLSDRENERFIIKAESAKEAVGKVKTLLWEDDPEEAFDRTLELEAVFETYSEAADVTFDTL